LELSQQEFFNDSYKDLNDITHTIYDWLLLAATIEDKKLEDIFNIRHMMGFMKWGFVLSFHYLLRYEAEDAEYK